MARRFCVAFLLLLITSGIFAEPVRVLLSGIHEITPARQEGNILTLGYNGATAIVLGPDARFLRGVQLDLAAPQNFLNNRGSMAALFYVDLRGTLPANGVADLDARQIHMEILPDRILNTWQIPLRLGHGLRSSPYVSIPTGIIPISSFPLLFRLMPAGKAITSDLERMVFQLHVRPVLGTEGAVKLNFIYPNNAPDGSITVLIDDVVIDNPEEERLLTQGEHSLLVISDNYRDHSRRFIVEAAKVLELNVELADPMPMLIFEYPENARIFVNNIPVANPNQPYPIEPGYHEVRFQISDYSITRPVLVQRGKTYTIALSVDVDIKESE